jgi:hypothetical protein
VRHSLSRGSGLGVAAQPITWQWARGGGTALGVPTSESSERYVMQKWHCRFRHELKQSSSHCSFSTPRHDTLPPSIQTELHRRQLACTVIVSYWPYCSCEVIARKAGVFQSQSRHCRIYLARLVIIRTKHGHTREYREEALTLQGECDTGHEAHCLRSRHQGVPEQMWCPAAEGSM